MRRLALSLGFLLVFCVAAQAQTSSAKVVTTCGTETLPLVPGATPLRVDTTGDLCTNAGGGGGGGAITAAINSYAVGALQDGADATQGTKADAAYAGSGSATVVSILKGIYNALVAALPAGSNIIGKVGIDQTTPGTTNAVQPLTSGDIIINPSANFTRPANTTAYASGQLVANSVTAGSVTPLSWTAARVATGNFRISRVRMTLSSKSVTNTNFRVHFFNLTTGVSNGDGATFLPSLAADEVCEMDVTIALAGADVSTGYGAANQGSACDVALGSGSSLFGLIEARAAYTPGSAEVITVVPEIHQN
jgi:hypothetical protein